MQRRRAVISRVRCCKLKIQQIPLQSIAWCAYYRERHLTMKERRLAAEVSSLPMQEEAAPPTGQQSGLQADGRAAARSLGIVHLVLVLAAKLAMLSDKQDAVSGSS